MDAVRSLSGDWVDKDLSGLLDELCPHQTLDAMMVSIFGLLLHQDETLDLAQVTLALKRLAAGLKAIYPMVKQENCAHHISQIFQKVDAMIRQVESMT